MSFFDNIKDIFSGEGDNKNLFRNIVILGMVGTLLLLFGNVFINTDEQSGPVMVNSPPADKIADTDLNYEKKISADLEEIISSIKGVGKVKVKVYITEQTTFSYEYNENKTNKITSETDQNGGQRQIKEDTIEKEMVIIKDEAGGEQPVIKKSSSPKITGIMIVAQGGENSKIKYHIINAVKALLNIPIYKISVLPYERR